MHYVYMEEEEEGGGSGGGYYKKPPIIKKQVASSKNNTSVKSSELQEWWEYATKEFSYDIYALLVCSEADDEVFSFFQNSREELAGLSGGEVCFLYFRNEGRAIELSEWTFTEHSNAVIPLANMLEVKRIPSIIFVGKTVMEQQVILPLDECTEKDVREVIRNIFRDFYSKENRSIDTLGELAKTIQKKRIKTALLGYAGSSVSELFKSVGKTAGGIWG